MKCGESTGLQCRMAVQGARHEGITIIRRGTQPFPSGPWTTRHEGRFEISKEGVYSGKDRLKTAGGKGQLVQTERAWEWITHLSGATVTFFLNEVGAKPVVMFWTPA